MFIYIKYIVSTCVKHLSRFLKYQFRKKNLAERGFDPRTSGLWAQHASTAPLCSDVQPAVDSLYKVKRITLATNVILRDYTSLGKQMVRIGRKHVICSDSQRNYNDRT